MRYFKIYTAGCKVNQYESQALREKFLKQGYRDVDDSQIAKLCIINTCTVTGAADGKSRSLIRQAIGENPKATVVVTGCYALKNSKEIIKIRGVSCILGNDWKDGLLVSDFKAHSRAWVKIQDGCNNACSYCKVPLVRGSSRSKEIYEVKEEVLSLLKKGFKEIVLCGVCLGSYGYDLHPAIDLVNCIEELDKLRLRFRLRLSSIEAKDINERLIKKIANSSLVCPHLHIPFQSGDDEVLKRMSRNYTREGYINLVKRLRLSIRHLAITTDIMVGFPGEKEKNFQNTLDFLKEVRPSRIHSFSFSPRPGTNANLFSERVSPLVIKHRMEAVKELAREISFAFRKQFLNQNLQLLLEEEPDRETGLFKGYSENYIKVVLSNSQDLDGYLHSLQGELIKVKVVEVTEDRTIAVLT